MREDGWGELVSMLASVDAHCAEMSSPHSVNHFYSIFERLN